MFNLLYNYYVISAIGSGAVLGYSALSGRPVSKRAVYGVLGTAAVVDITLKRLGVF